MFPERQQDFTVRVETDDEAHIVLALGICEYYRQPETKKAPQGPYAVGEARECIASGVLSRLCHRSKGR